MNLLPSLDVIGQGHRWTLVNKPAGIAVERNKTLDTVELRAVRQFRRSRATKDPYVGIVHRLDKPTSGCLLLTHNKSTLVDFQQQWEDRKVTKTYWALVNIPPSQKSGILTHYIFRDRTGRKAIASARPLRNAKKAELHFKLILSEADYTLLEIKLMTGRFHQIRAQLAAIGSPIIGDSLYGDVSLFRENIIALHARSLSFEAYLEDPATGGKKETLSYEATLPTYWPMNDDSLS
ncbi:MAG: RNA pseudouridine synthase [Bacteroidota bacterium]